MKRIITVILICLMPMSLFAQYKSDSTKIVNIEKQLAKIKENVSDAGSNFETALLSNLIGVSATILLALATYDNNTKTFNNISYIPAALGFIVSLIAYFNGTSDLKKASKY